MAAALVAFAGSWPSDMSAIVCHRRRRALFEQDTVSRPKLAEILQQKLQECSAIHGDSLHRSLSALDASVGLQLQTVLNVCGPSV